MNDSNSFVLLDLPTHLLEDFYRKFGEECWNPQEDRPDLPAEQMGEFFTWIREVEPGSSFLGCFHVTEWTIPITPKHSVAEEAQKIADQLVPILLEISNKPPASA